MTVDPRKPRQILVVHGVQTGTDAELDQHEHIRRLVQSRLNGVPVKFKTDLYRYENINDDAVANLQLVLKAVGSAMETQVPLIKTVTSIATPMIDLIGDVVISLENGSTAAKIRSGLRARIMETYNEDGGPLYVVAHSLGSVYAFDVVNELMRERPAGVFEGDKRKTWPVQGLVTLGSPLGLAMFRNKRVLTPLKGRKWFRWFNYWARTDPIVSASFFGDPVVGYEIIERYFADKKARGWIPQDRVLDIGRAWMFAHTAYWDHGPLGDDLVTLISS